MQESAAYIKYCRFCWYGGRCFRIALAGSFSSAVNWAGVIGVGILGFALQQLFGSSLPQAQSWKAVVGQGLLFIAAAWVAIFIARILFYAPFVMHREGIWHGNKFVYREPKLAFHEYISPQQNNREFQFRFPDAPPFSDVTYRIEPEGMKEHLSVSVAAHPYGLQMFKSHEDFRYGGGTMRVNKERKMYARFFLRPDVDPRSVRIYVTAWEEKSPIEPPEPKQDRAPAAYWGG